MMILTLRLSLMMMMMMMMMIQMVMMMMTDSYTETVAELKQRRVSVVATDGYQATLHCH